MASVIRYPSGRYWIAAFRDASGRQHRRTTRETDKKRAQAVAEKYEMAAKRKGSPQRVRQIFHEFYRDHYGEDLPSSNVRTYAESWLAVRKAETSPGTYRRYSEAAVKFLSFLGPQADRDLDEITKAHISGFRDAQRAVSAPATTNHALKIVRMIFRSARREGYLWQDPAEGVKAVKNGMTLERRPFTINEIRAVLEVASPEWQSLIKFGIYTGQRLGDLASLTWAQIDLVDHPQDRQASPHPDGCAATRASAHASRSEPS
jgi:integrase